MLSQMAEQCDARSGSQQTWQAHSRTQEKFGRTKQLTAHISTGGAAHS